jgi:adenylosuccinate lyase
MHPRYPARHAQRIWHPDATITLWAEITQRYAIESLGGATDETGHPWADRLYSFKIPSSSVVDAAERMVGHEVVAFLDRYMLDMPPEIRRHIHVGLTSSDLVDYALFEQMREHARYMTRWVRAINATLIQSGADTGIRAGRTHGQLAAPTSWSHQMLVIHQVLDALAYELNDYANDRILKTPGPTGTSERKINLRSRERWVISTQVIPRDFVLRWAALYLRLSCQLENLALQVRLASRSEVREVREGRADERVGSSSMPTKRNPIDSEKICGLARVVRGQFMALSEGVALWEDRDLTNSSLERITIPDMAATVEYMLDTMHYVMQYLVFDESRMHSTAALAQVHTAAAQSLLQTTVGMDPVEAGDLIRECGRMDNRFWTHLRQLVWNRVREAKGQELADAWSAEFTHYYMKVTEQ